MIKDKNFLESKDIWKKIGEIPLDYFNAYLNTDIKYKGELMRKVPWDDICDVVYEWESNFVPYTQYIKDRINMYKYLKKWSTK